MSSEFITPEPQDFVNALGVEPNISGDTQRTLKLSDVIGEDVTFSYDAVGGSVRVAWRAASGGDLISIYREGATLLRIIEDDDGTRLLIEFRTRDTVGELRVQVFPELSISESQLLS
ncbi:hypothetical protein AB0K47_28805 [Streptomyces tirandamycinicus]|uniref:hypothetical protein n=1 Tax=Streptomyces tirandamycinicus TaxID=2174846 RepID=UPI00344AB78E